MSLTHRKPRPLKRDSDSLRDDRLFIIACDDTYAPKQYFNFFCLPRVQVHVVPTDDGTSSAQYVLDRLLNFELEEEDELWMLLDTDHCIEGNHQKRFLQTINDAKQRDINIALSKPCFEFWLLLHHVDESEVVSLVNAKDTEHKLRDVLGEYNKLKLKQEHYPLNSVVDACRRAEKLDKNIFGGDIPENNTSRVYLLWKAIVSKSMATQLPIELQDLLIK